ncbi:kinase-like domain-containing protein [Immersiella caudata]|uniref:EKC/KEOPS complex subunit BUD32 n=1 Tax=Immersiella caudata TaxID=314043 RepID=A0AA39WG16_9PEZI|nr:kinase-like domain-containing protein [Immersiella caudata]
MGSSPEEKDDGVCDGDKAERAPSNESTPEVVYCGDFAVIRPEGDRAISAFNDLVFALLENGDPTERPEPYHARFLCLEASPTPLPDPPSPFSDSSCSAAPLDTTASRGCYRLSLDVLPEGPGGAWRIGKGSARAGDGSRGIDLLLVPPGQHKGSGVANVHATISIHSQSGAFMLRSTSSRPIIYMSAAEDGSDLVLRQGGKAVLHKTVNRLRIGALDFLLSFSVEQINHFQVLRDQFITSILEQPAAPHSSIDAIPQAYHQRIAGYITHKSISAGAFGMVRSAVDSATGRPVAVKRLSCKGRRESSAVEAEARIAGLFRSDDPGSGVIPLLSVFCEHNAKFPCGRSPEDVFLVMPLAQTDFGHADWLSIPAETRLALFRDTLIGLKRIHASGIMHRDISPKNLLIRSLDPPVAAICDFGKATNQRHSTNTAIGPIDTVAPEVWASTPRNPYTRAADVWSLGYAWLSTFGHLRDLMSADGNLKTDEVRARRIHRELDSRVRSGLTPSSLGDLLKAMMSFEATQRCTAEQALGHPAWRTDRLSAQSEESHTAGEKKFPSTSVSRKKTKPAKDNGDLNIVVGKELKPLYKDVRALFNNGFLPSTPLGGIPRGKVNQGGTLLQAKRYHPAGVDVKSQPEMPQPNADKSEEDQEDDDAEDSEPQNAGSRVLLERAPEY